MAVPCFPHYRAIKSFYRKECDTSETKLCRMYNQMPCAQFLVWYKRVLSFSICMQKLTKTIYISSTLGTDFFVFTNLICQKDWKEITYVQINLRKKNTHSRHDHNWVYMIEQRNANLDDYQILLWGRKRSIFKSKLCIYKSRLPKRRMWPKGLCEKAVKFKVAAKNCLCMVVRWWKEF